MGTVPADDLDASVRTLAELLEIATAGAVTMPDPAASADLPLRSLQLDSIAYLAFLSSIEETFEIRWDYEEPPGAFDSLRTIAAHLRETKGVGR